MSTGLTILSSVLAGVVLLGVAGCLVILRRQKRRQRDVGAWKMTPFRALDFTEREVVARLLEENVIGSGGSGKVYRVHLDGGNVVAVKRLWTKRDEKEFESEVKVLGDIRHNNIVSLLCCVSSGDGDRLLVYEYMENGSLDRWLHRREGLEPLDWPTRLRIAIDAARGLSYMHHECARPIMHRDVKSSNILLDPAFRAKVADFGIARILANTGEPESVSAVRGTFGYMAPGIIIAT
jgi:kinase